MVPLGFLTTLGCDEVVGWLANLGAKGIVPLPPYWNRLLFFFLRVGAAAGEPAGRVGGSHFSGSCEATGTGGGPPAW
jgi:hypothetical protein